MKRILSFILAICLILTLAPVTIYAAEPTLGTPTLVGDYTFNKEFADSEFGKLVLSDFTTENDTFDVTYPDGGGVRVTRNSTTGTKSGSVPKFSINFIKAIDVENLKYQQNLKGVYAIDITFKSELTAATSNGRTDTYITATAGIAEKSDCNIRLSPASMPSVYDVTAKKFSFSNKIGTDYQTYRFVIDTSNDMMYGYDYINGEFVYAGESNYALDAIGSFVFAPRETYITEGSYIEFKDLKIYEFEDKNPALPDEPDIPDEPDEPDIPDVPDEPEHPTDPYLGGTLLFDYDLNKEFAESEVGKQVIVDNYDTCGYEFNTKYTDEGIEISYDADPVFTDENLTSGVVVDAFGLNFAALVDNDEENTNRVYKTGFSGIYALEFTINLKQGENWANNKSSGRTDLFIGNSASAFVTTNNINHRISNKSGSLSIYSGTTKAYTSDTLNFGTDRTIRIVVDTVNHKYYGYTKLDDGTYKEDGSGDYPLSALTYMWYRTRTYAQKGDTFTFKNIKLYEISRDETAVGEVNFDTVTNDMSTLPDTFVGESGNVVNNKEVTENFIIPNILRTAYGLKTSDENLLNLDGVVNRTSFDNSLVNLMASGGESGVYFTKIYDFVIKARDDLDTKIIAEYDFTSENVTNELICSGDNKVTGSGFKVVNKEYTDNTTIGLLKSNMASDSNSDTYIYDYDGGYDFEIDLMPAITEGKASVEIGNYDNDTNVFESFAKINVTPEGAIYSTGFEDIPVADVADEYKLKLRVDTTKNTFWVWANSKTPSKYGYTYDGNKSLNAYKISFDDAGENDSVTLKNAEFTQLIKLPNEHVTNALSIVNSITINDLVSSPDDAYGDIKLPSVGGYKIDWSADNSLVDLDAKKIYRSTKDEDITITAFVSSVEKPEIKVRKDFYLKVKAATNSTDILDGALARITAESVTNQSQLVADLKLPKVTDEGYTVTWDSLSDGYISDEGVINKDINIATPTEVEFKVTVSSGSASVNKNIIFTIGKRGADVVLTPDDITESAEGVVTYKAVVSGNGTAYLKDSQGKNIIGFSVDNSKLTIDYKNSDNKQYSVNSTFEIAIVMNTTNQCASVIVDGNVILDYVPYLLAVDGYKYTDVTGFNITNEKVVFDEYSLFDYNMKLFDYIDTFGTVFVAEDRTFKTDSIGGVTVKWTSSNETIMTNEGIYNEPLNIEFYRVNLKMAVNEGTGAEYSKDIICVAVPSEDTNLMNESTIISDVDETAQNDKTKSNDGNLKTYFTGKKLTQKKYITVELDRRKEINSVYFFQYADTGIKSCDIYLSDDGNTWTGPVASPVFTDLESNLVVFDYQYAKYIRLTNIIADDNTFDLYELKAYLGYTAGNKAQFDIAALDMPTDYNLKVTSLNLLKTGSVYGSKFTWTSTKPNVISTDGVISKPTVATEVILTVTAEFEGTTATKKFTYLVPAASGSSGGSGGGGGAGGGGGSYAGNISGVNTGGAGMASTPTQSEVELEKTEVPEVNNGIFKDTSTDAWYYDYLVDLVDKGIVNGYDDGKFYPNKQVTREEFVKMLIVASGIELTYNNTGFADVKDEVWYTSYIYTAKENGIVSGISKTDFGVGMNISRQDMAVMVHNLLMKNMDISYDKETYSELFTDDSSIAWYAYNDVYAIKRLGILSGYETGEFKPNDNLTRAEAVKVISLILELM